MNSYCPAMLCPTYKQVPQSAACTFTATGEQVCTTSVRHPIIKESYLSTKTEPELPSFLHGNVKQISSSGSFFKP